MGRRVFDQMARRLIRAGKSASEHDRRRARDEREKDVLVVRNPSVGDDGNLVPDGAIGLADRLELRNPGGGLEPGAAAAARPDSDLDGVDAAIGEEPRALVGGYVPA